ncbi:hypothetical protein ACFCXP_11160 [Streptomyces niveus]|uniref:hypothetical protein n=1 Tax=Streptomyces niveus TaxID=193462 RepID=UPI0035D97E78
MTVSMSHSGLPAGQDIEVPEVSVRAYERMGWTVVGGQVPDETTKAAEAKGRRRPPKEN